MNERNGISIAVLTDNQDDVELVNATLRDAGHAAHCEWIQNPARFDEALARDDIELIMLCTEHYADGIRPAVRQKDAYRPELPVIALATDVTEQAIQDALTSGAKDLVSTSSRMRWLKVVERELRTLRIERALNSAVLSANEYKRHAA
ncbi:MAG: hypothetical protein U5K38_13570 [Woeseiaceae bacterium]|nr:hypothetical protein [Woeseiaceae bacterium]